MNNLINFQDNFDNLLTNINNYVADNVSLVEENEDIAKWATIPDLYGVDDEIKKYISDFMIKLDNKNINLDTKIKYFINLSSIILLGNLNVLKYDFDEISLLINYFYNKNISSFSSDIIIVSNKKILKTVRNKVIELLYRVKILDYVIYRYNNEHDDSSTFIDKVITEIIIKDYDELVNY